MDLTTLTLALAAAAGTWIWAFTTQDRAAQFLGCRHGFFHRKGGLAFGTGTPNARKTSLA